MYSPVLVFFKSALIILCFGTLLRTIVVMHFPMYLCICSFVRFLCGSYEHGNSEARVLKFCRYTLRYSMAFYTVLHINLSSSVRVVGVGRCSAVGRFLFRTHRVSRNELFLENVWSWINVNTSSRIHYNLLVLCKEHFGWFAAEP